MRTAKELKKGKIDGTIYDFSEAGDILESHTHTTTNTHIAIVARGSFKAFGTNWEMIAKTGDILDIQADQLHGFEALENDSRLINIRK